MQYLLLHFILAIYSGVYAYEYGFTYKENDPLIMELAVGPHPNAIYGGFQYWKIIQFEDMHESLMVPNYIDGIPPIGDGISNLIMEASDNVDGPPILAYQVTIFRPNFGATNTDDTLTFIKNYSTIPPTPVCLLPSYNSNWSSPWSYGGPSVKINSIENLVYYTLRRSPYIMIADMSLALMNSTCPYSNVPMCPLTKIELTYAPFALAVDSIRTLLFVISNDYPIRVLDGKTGVQLYSFSPTATVPSAIAYDSKLQRLYVICSTSMKGGADSFMESLYVLDMHDLNEPGLVNRIDIPMTDKFMGMSIDSSIGFLHLLYSSTQSPNCPFYWSSINNNGKHVRNICLGDILASGISTNSQTHDVFFYGSHNQTKTSTIHLFEFPYKNFTDLDSNI